MLALYKNIKSRRTELKMSQDTLAELTGYKDRSSIAKIEKGEVDLSESKIREFAKALKLSPQELTGWDKNDELRPDLEDLIKKVIPALRLDDKHQKEAIEKIVEESLIEEKDVEESPIKVNIPAFHSYKDEYTEEELKQIKDFAEYVKTKRKK